MLVRGSAPAVLRLQLLKEKGLLAVVDPEDLKRSLNAASLEELQARPSVLLALPPVLKLHARNKLVAVL